MIWLILFFVVIFVGTIIKLATHEQDEQHMIYLESKLPPKRRRRGKANSNTQYRYDPLTEEELDQMDNEFL